VQSRVAGSGLRRRVLGRLAVVVRLRLRRVLLDSLSAADDGLRDAVTDSLPSAPVILRHGAHAGAGVLVPFGRGIPEVLRIRQRSVS
jgi:hypothetical protein